MRPRMVADFVPFGDDPLHDVRVLRRAFADHEKGRVNLALLEHVQQARRVRTARAVIEGDGDVGAVDVARGVGDFWRAGRGSSGRGGRCRRRGSGRRRHWGGRRRRGLRGCRSRRGLGRRGSGIGPMGHQGGERGEGDDRQAGNNGERKTLHEVGCLTWDWGSGKRDFSRYLNSANEFNPEAQMTLRNGKRSFPRALFSARLCASAVDCGLGGLGDEPLQDHAEFTHRFGRPVTAVRD